MSTKLRILVPIKRVLDYAIKPRIRKDQTGVDLSNPHSLAPSQFVTDIGSLAGLKMSMNPFCELAVEQSLRLREGKVPSLPVESITAISIGPAKTQDTLRTALAMGADKAIHVEVEDDPEPLGVAKVLKAIAEREGCNLILLGQHSIDRDFGQTGQMLGGLLGWAQVTIKPPEWENWKG
jgi:electron transfer flavoprotein beta subunit